MADKELSDKQKEAGFAGKTVKVLSQISKKLDEQTKTIEGQSSAADVGDRIQKLGGVLGTKNNESTKQFKESFAQVNKDLKNAISSGDADAESAALKQLNALEKAVQSEEKRREQEKLLQEQNDFLERTAEGVNLTANKFDEFAGNVTGGVGFLASIAGIALLFIDPQKFAQIIGDAITSVSNVLSNLVKLFEGEQGIEATMKGMGDDFSTFAAMIAGITLLSGGSLLTSLGNTIKAVNAMRLFFMGTFLPMMGTAMLSLVTGFATVLSAVIPVVAPIALIVLGALALYGILDTIAQELDFSNIFDAVLVAVAYVGDALAAVGNFFIMLGKFIGDALGSVAAFFGFEIPPALAAMADAEYLATDAGDQKKAEMQAKKQKEELERIAKGEGKEDPFGFGVIDQRSVPTPEEIAAAQAELGFDLNTATQDAENLIMIPQPDLDADLSMLTQEQQDLIQKQLDRQNGQATTQNIIKGGDTSTNNSSVVTISNSNGEGFLDNQLIHQASIIR